MSMYEALTHKWYHLRDAEHVSEWEDFDTFLDWAEASGYQPGDMLRRMDRRKPYGPSNCYWQAYRKPPNSPDSETDLFIKKWNKTVNVFRKAIGLPLFEETRT